MWAVRNARNYLVLDKFYKRYGDFVRTGPSEITVYHPDVFKAIDGAQTKCTKSDWYDFMKPDLSLVLERDRTIHSRRRKEWSNGMSTSGLASYNRIFQRHASKLDLLIEEKAASGSPVKMHDVLYWYTFDSMGDMLFSKSFGMLDGRGWHDNISRIKRGIYLIGLLSPVPWLFNLGLRYGPRLSIIRDFRILKQWCRKEMMTRLEAKSSTEDLAYYMMEKDGKTTDAERLAWLTGDSILAIVVGSEPIGGALLGIFYHLARCPNHADKIFEEARDVDTTDLKALQNMPHLNAVINESSRFFPTVPSAGARKSGVNGVTIGGVFIPPNTNIIPPRFSIYRREDCYERPNEFIPERWTTKPEMIRNPAAFNPFGMGTTSCLGKALSLDVMRYTVAMLVKKYHIRFAPGETGERVMGNMLDHFSSSLGGLDLCFEARDQLP